MKSGFVSIIGRPNVGKSTLLNNLIGKKIAITSSKAQTTRNIIEGIYNEKDMQIIFVDTPGIHKPKYKLGKYLNKQAYIMIDDVDIILFMIDAKSGYGKGDEFILEKLKDINKPIILLLNKIDELSNEEILKTIDECKDLYDFKEIIPISSLKNRNTDRLIEVLKKYLPDEIKYFDDDTITNVKTSFIISEYVREKVLELTNEEVPHSVTCFVEDIEYKKNIVDIKVCIVVDRDNLKKIIIGKNGIMLKNIGSKSRYDIEKYLGKKVYLELYVKSIKNWRDKEKYLQEFGFKDFE